MNENTISSLKRNRQVIAYIRQHFCDEYEPCSFARLNSEKEGLKSIHVPSNVGKMLYLLARLQNAKKILEIGTLGGYSTLWLAKALPPEGKLITIDCIEKHAKTAKANFIQAGLEELIEIRLGLASEVLEQMVEEGPFDLIFIDADKDNYPNYLEPCIQLSRPGTLILSDNLIPKRGEIANPDPRDREAVGIYTFNQLMAHHPNLEAGLFPTIVGEKGRIDALGVAIVR